MAERRMFAKTIVLSDAFLDMPPSARCLYFTYGMLADDDGFVNNPKSVMRQCGSTAEDIRQLVDGGYIIKFDSGVIAITAWRVNNLIKNDRYVPTACTKEKKMLNATNSGFYVESTCGSDNSAKNASPVPVSEPSCIHSGSTAGTKVEPTRNQSGTEEEPQDRLGKVSIGQDNKKTSAHGGAHACEEPKRKFFTPPTVEEVREYCRSRNNNIDPEQFCSFYESKGWMVGQNRMKDWKASIRTWERSREHASPSSSQNKGSFDTDDFFQAALNRKFYDWEGDKNEQQPMLEAESLP